MYCTSSMINRLCYLIFMRLLDASPSYRQENSRLVISCSLSKDWIHSKRQTGLQPQIVQLQSLCPANSQVNEQWNSHDKSATILLGGRNKARLRKWRGGISTWENQKTGWISSCLPGSDSGQTLWWDVIPSEPVQAICYLIFGSQ